MLLDLFSSVDYSWSTFNFIKLFVWVLGFFWGMALLLSYWFTNKSYMSVMLIMKNLFSGGASVVMQQYVKGVSNMVGNMFFLMFLLNMWGLVPYVFGVTTQMMWTFSLSLIVWLVMVSSSLIYSPVLFFGHLTPQSSPLWLVPLLNIMELVSALMRPLTLSLRLSMKMTTGHVFVTLLSTGALALFFNFNLLLFMVMIMSSFYFLFELGMSFMQGFVFGLLTNQYVDEHS